jgi:integrase
MWMEKVPAMKQGTLEKAKTAKGLVWYLRYTDSTGAKTVRPRVRIGLVAEYSTKGKAWRAAEPILKRINGLVEGRKTFGDLLDRYIAEAMPPRHSTRRGYQSMINAHIRPRWGKTPLEDVHSYETEVWLLSLPIGTRRKGHIHGLMRVLFRYAMHIRWLLLQANPMHSFSIQGATKRKTQPGTLTHEQFHGLLEKIADEPYRTMVIAAQCLGLRVSELLALQWADVDFLGARITVARAIVEQHLGAVKTYQSARQLPLHAHVSQLFLSWRKQTEFTEPKHFIFASPWQAGELPYNASKIQSSILRKAGKAIGLTFSLGWHTFRHTYRAFLRQAGAPMDVQRDLMRHADIQTTMQTYGGTQLDELRPINSTVVDSLFGGRKQ